MNEYSSPHIGDITPLVCQGEDVTMKIVTLSGMVCVKQCIILLYCIYNKSIVCFSQVPNCTNFTSYRVDAEIEFSQEPELLVIDGIIDNKELINFNVRADIKANVTVTLISERGVPFIYRNISIGMFSITMYCYC